MAQAGVECAEACGCAPPPTDTPAPTPTPGGDCCTAHAGASCDDTACRTCVCGRDNDCCESVWDQTCTEEARVECALECSCPTVGSCCEAHGGIGCDDVVCKDCVCDLDPACCTDGLGWDADCVSRANIECAVSCTCEPAGSCCVEHFDTLGCDDRRCQDCVCAFDAPCCTEGWDSRCAEVAGSDCSERCTGCVNCCDVSDSPGCSEDSCESCVCALDNFCCDEGWDGGCVDRAFENCGSLCTCTGTSACAGDCDGNDEVAVNELIKAVNIALGNDPVSECPAVDTVADGEVAVNELIQAVNSALNTCAG